jgi:hypothetical protein
LNFEDVFMSAIWKNHAIKLTDMIKENNETKAHLYLEQLMLLPVNIQDDIIEEISHLKHCHIEAVAGIISHYTTGDHRLM